MQKLEKLELYHFCIFEGKSKGFPNKRPGLSVKSADVQTLFTGFTH